MIGIYQGFTDAAYLSFGLYTAACLVRGVSEVIKDEELKAPGLSPLGSPTHVATTLRKQHRHRATAITLPGASAIPNL